MSPRALLRDARLWIALAMLAVLSLILVWWFWYVLELGQALSLIGWENDQVVVDGVVVSEVNLVNRERERHGRWTFWANDADDPNDKAMVSCGWNTYDEREALIPFSIPLLYRRAVSGISGRIGRQPEIYRWEDRETWGRLSAVWQLDSQYVEVSVGHSNDNDGIGIVIVPGRLDWDAVSKSGRPVRQDRRAASAQAEADFLATFTGR